MKYFGQILIISVITFLGELLNQVIPIPVPGSIYGMLLLFLALMTGVIKLSQVEDTANLLVSIMPIMFVSPSVSIMDTYGGISNQILSLFLISIFSTFVVMTVTGLVAQAVIRKKRRE